MASILEFLVGGNTTEDNLRLSDYTKKNSASGDNGEVSLLQGAVDNLRQVLSL